MARVAKSAKAYQVFRGGLNDLSKTPWIQNLGNGCCEVAPVIDQDRLNPTINPENSLVHTRPYGNRDYWQFSEMSDSDRARVVKHLNDNGVGAQLEVLVLPTFSLLSTVAIVTFAEEAGLVFEIKTRNGTVLPSGQLIKVLETEGADCSGVVRVKSAADPADIGPLEGATRVHNLFVSGKLGEFALDADVLILEVLSMPAGGIAGAFDLRVHANYVAPGRSEAKL
jgi:hypothetical protein